jgi:phosphosulfolactate phosphohydrolase-like enzyme
MSALLSVLRNDVYVAQFLKSFSRQFLILVPANQEHDTNTDNRSFAEQAADFRYIRES